MKNKLFLIIACICIGMCLVLNSCTLSEPQNNGNQTGNKTSGTDNVEDNHVCSMVEVSRIDATYTAAGTVTYRCSCGEERIETLKKLNHTYSEAFTYDDETHWYACTDDGYENLKKAKDSHTLVAGTVTPATYESAELTEYTCVCGYSTQKQTADMLLHDYASTWSYDTTSHWHACTDGGYEKLKKDKDSHTLVAGTVTPATYESAELTEYTCICGYSKQIQTSDMLSHNYQSVFSYDETGHWYACTDDGYGNLKKDESAHTLVAGTVTPATYNTPEITEYTCICGYTKQMQTTDILTHNYSSDWSYDSTSHWHACTDEGYEHLKKNESSHTLVAGTVIPATYETAEFTQYSCECGYSRNVQTANMLSHSYSSDWSYDSTSHWHACTDEGYTNLKADEALHQLSESNFDASTGYTAYSCICGYIEQRLYAAVITSKPTVTDTVYIGQKLSDIILTGGSGNVNGTFVWSNPEAVVTGSGSYNVTFVPTNTEYASITTQIQLTATQLTVTVNVGENGSASSTGVVNVNYGASLTVIFTPDSGYDVESVVVGGAAVSNCTEYTFDNITSNQTLSVTFVQQTNDNTETDTDTNTGTDTGTDDSENWSFALTCLLGTPACYTYDGTTLTFTEISAESAYSISGELVGNIVIDVGDTYKFDLEMHGFTLTSTSINPITVLSGSEVSLKAKNGYENFIYDNREAIDQTDTTLYSAAIYSLVDLELAGKGSLKVVSANNNGIHTKDDLQVKNLTLYVSCIDNALKGNDSVEITSAVTTLISRQGDCIKTTNSHINETTGNQKGTVYIAGGTHNLYAACDGIDASYNVLIEDSLSSVTVLNIYTDKYSEYSEEVTAVSSSTYYLRYTSSAYKYSIRYYNSTTGEYEWVNASDTYETVTSSSSNRPGGSGSTYYYYTFAKLSDYDKLAVYMYSSNQAQGQDTDYYACSSDKALNDSYDTISLSYRNSSLSVSWTNYGTTSSSGGIGGMQEGNTDKGTYSTKGIKAANEITVNSGTITIKAYDDAIHANNDGGTLENGAAPIGNVTINGGVISIYSNDDGLHADGTLSMTSGTVSITNAYEGVEGSFIIISGGSLSVISSDDGFNGTSTSGAAIQISGGKVYVYAGGDGIDSNSTTSKGAILFSGGDVVVFCTSGGNAAIDSDGGYTHSGGRVIALTSSGGMTSEVTNGNSTGMTTNSSVSLSNGGYLTVTVSGTVVATVKMPCSMTAHVVYLGSNSATIASASSSSLNLDSNGVYWTE